MSNVDILGYYPQVYGHFYLTGTITGAAPIFVEFNTTEEAINCSILGGVPKVTLPGIYFIDVSVEYDVTAGDVGTQIQLTANGDLISFSTVESFAENAAVAQNRLLMNTMYDFRSSDPFTEFEVYMFSYPTGDTRTVRSTEAKISTRFKIVRLR